MIPKIIHYCWFGRNPLPELAIKCIESWKKYLPDYKIKEWNEDNFNVNIIPYTAEAYKMKKYAFVSDYARFWILYKYGGIYFDTDVEVIKPIDDIIEKGNFIGLEKDGSKRTALAVAPGLGLGVNPGLSLIKELTEKYNDRHFEYHANIRMMQTIVYYTTKHFLENGLKYGKGVQKIDEMWVYPSEYFCPINLTTGRLHITKNTRTIHHYAGKWMEHPEKSLKDTLKAIIPECILLLYNRLKSRNKYGI